MTDNLIERLERGETGIDLDRGIVDALALEYEGPHPLLTCSLDDALAHMVPEGWRVREIVWHYPSGQFKECDAQLWSPHDSGMGSVSGIAPTAAGAVCVAGIRARSRPTP